MGTIRNEMVVVQHWNLEKLEKLRESAIQKFKKIVNNYNIEKMVSPIMESYINCEYTFVINGECSKVNWEDSNLFHDVRMKWCKKHKNDVENIVVINFGEDGSCHIIFDNKAESEKNI